MGTLNLRRRRGRTSDCLRPACAPGFSLMEVLMAAAVLAFVVAAVSQAIVAGQNQSYNAIHELRALSLCEALMEEILSKPYLDPNGGGVASGPDAGETSRSLYDNADDYHNFTETTGNCKDAAGVAYPSTFSVFSRTATAGYTTQTVTGLGTINGITVTVTVTDTHGRMWTITRFIAEPEE